MPALPLDEAGKYVAGAYVVFFTLIVVYISIIGAKIARIDRELGELGDLLDDRGDGGAKREGIGAPNATSHAGAAGERRDEEPVA
jgi:hypothetical protein